MSMNGPQPELLEIQQALRFSEMRFAHVLDTVHDGVISINEHQRIMIFNQGAERIFGYMRDEVIGQNMAMLLPNRFGHAHGEQIKKYGHLESHPRMMAHDRVMVMGKRKNGEEFPAEVSISSMANGSETIYTAVVRDVSDKQRVQNTLQVTEQQFRLLIAGVTDYAIYMLDLRGNVKTWNLGAQRIKGYTDAEIIGKHYSIFFSPEDIARKEPNHILETAIRDGRFAGERWQQRKDGSRFRAEVVLTILQDDQNQMIGFSIITKDVTERNRTETALQETLKREQELSMLKSRIVSMASHELKAPLSVILASAETIQTFWEKLDRDKIGRKLSLISQSVRRLTGLIDDILDLGRLQSGQVSFAPLELDFDQLCRTIIDEFRGVPEHTQTIDYRCEKSPLNLLIDEKLMRQVMTNLLSNALKYSAPASTVSVILEVKDDLAQLQIQDQGIGIPESELSLIFEPFHRAANVGGVTGTGLGLNIVYEAINLHGGTIHVASEEGVGTSFTIWLPVRASQQ
ncbi:MAG: PAS domain S-box protein [Anaerolineae bacterium]